VPLVRKAPLDQLDLKVQMVTLVLTVQLDQLVQRDQLVPLV
jgi:hypothetical protein